MILLISIGEVKENLYCFIHDQTLRLANNGHTPVEIANMIKLPESLDKQFYNRGTMAQ